MPDFFVHVLYDLPGIFLLTLSEIRRLAVHILRHDVFELASIGQHGHLHHSLSMYILAQPVWVD